MVKNRFIVRNEIEENILKSLLDSEYNLKLWRKLGEQYTIYDKITMIVLAITTFGTIVGWVIWFNWDYFWKSLSILSFLIAIILLIIPLQDSLKIITDNYRKTLESKIEFENLWNDKAYLTERTLRNKYKKILVREKYIELSLSVDFWLKNSEKVKVQCRNEILKSWGIE